MRFPGRLGGNSIRDEGAKAIGEALLVNKSLTSIEYATPLEAPAAILSAAPDTSGPASMLSACLSACLLGSLYYNGIGDEGAKHLSEGLKSNSTLRELECATHP